MRIPPLPARAVALAVLAALLACGAPPAAAAPDGPRVTVRALDAARLEGVLTALDAESLALQVPGAASPRALTLDGVVDLTFEERPVPRVKGPRFRAHLVGGEQLVGGYAGPSPDGIVLDVPGLGALPLLFEHVLTLESMPPDAGPCHDLAGEHPRPDGGDVAYDRGGDEYAGTVLEATKDDLVLESKRGSSRRIAWDDLKLAHLENVRLDAPRGLQAEVELAGGSRLPVASLALTADGLRLTLRSAPKTPRTVPFAHVRWVRWKGGRFVYASDLPHQAERREYHADPEGLLDPAYLERWFGTRVDRRASGCPLRMGGETFRHGFGVYSHSVVTIPLAGGYTSFRATFGIDDEVLAEAGHGALKGNVDARVLADGKVLWEAKGVRGGEKPRRVGPLDVKGVETLVLEVGFGQELYALDRGDWGDPLLVKARRE